MNQRHTYDIGKIYGVKQLLDIYRGDDGHLKAHVKCVNCGKESVVRTHSLFDKRFTSCTCQLWVDPDSHKTSFDERLYGIYANMKYRCYTKTCAMYKNYGGRGITVCDEWLGKDGYKNFAAWSRSHGYAECLTIDRIDVNLGYSPENCQWITKSENTSRSNRIKRTQRRKADNGDYYAIDGSGNLYIFSDANSFADEHGLNAGTLRSSARRNKKCKDWVVGYVCDLPAMEPASTIESPTME